MPKSERPAFPSWPSRAALAFFVTLFAALLAPAANAKYVNNQEGVPDYQDQICSLIQLAFDLAEEQAELDARHGKWDWLWQAVEEMKKAARDWEENGCGEFFGSLHNYRRVSQPDDLDSYFKLYLYRVQTELAQENAPASSGESGDGSIGQQSPRADRNWGSDTGSGGGCRLCVD